MAPTAPSIREYDGAHDAADLSVADGVFVTVVNRNLSDEQAEQLGYSFDPDVLLAEKVFAHRRVTVSPELSERLDGSLYQHPDDEPGELRAEWPRVGGTASADSIVDVPDSNPSTKPYELDDGTFVTPAELDAAAARDAGIDEVIETVSAEATTPEAVVAELAGRREQIELRVTQIDDALEELAARADQGGLDDNETAQRAELTAEADRLREEHKAVVNAIEQGA